MDINFLVTVMNVAMVVFGIYWAITMAIILNAFRTGEIDRLAEKRKQAMREEAWRIREEEIMI